MEGWRILPSDAPSLSSALVWQLHAVQSDKREEAETCAASIIVCHAIIVNEVTVFAIGRDRTVVLTFLMSFACSGETNSKLSGQRADS